MHLVSSSITTMDNRTSQAWAAAASKATAILEQLTQTEKIHLLSGRDFARIPGNARLKVPCLKTGDGPNGVRGASVSLDQVVGFPFHPTGKTAAGSVMFPCASAVAATWSPQTAERAGECIARDGWSKSVHMILAPTINMVRDPRNGRAFECFSEDPILTYYMGASWTVGAQEKAGVPVTLKHFVCNECETARHLSNVIVDQKTLREVYARPFELIIRQLRKASHIEPAAIMMAYNSVQGRSCSANKMLIKKLLRDEFGFHGLVMSDWFGTYVKAGESMEAGLDIEMPGPSFHRSETSITNALQEGSLDQALIDQCASKVLQTAFFAQDLSQGAYRFFCEDELDKDIETSAAAAVGTGQPSSGELSEQMRSVAAEATVLLKNDKGLLPLDASRLRSVVVIGDPAVQPLTSGGGSANMPSYYETPALDALQRALPDADIQWFRGCKLTSKLPSLSGTQLADERVTMTWHGVDTATDAIKDEILHTSEHPSTELRGFLGGYQADSAYFAIRTSFAVVPKTSGLHKMSFQAFGSLKVSIKESADAGDPRTLSQFDYEGENDLPTFMFNPERIRRVEQLQLTAGVPIQVNVEYKTPKHPMGFLPSHNAAFRVGYEEAYDEAALIDAAASAAATADVAIVFTGTGAEYESEGNDRSDISLPGHQNALVAAVGAATSNTIVVNASGSAVSMPWANTTPAIVQAWFGGCEAGNAIADVLLGKREPGGRLPSTWPQVIEDHPSFANFPASAPGPITEKHGEKAVEYAEGTLFGYRWFEKTQRQPLWWFGHGLTYTSFAVELVNPLQGASLQQDDLDGVLQIGVKVTNTGSRVGKHVLQVYHVAASDGEERPRRLVALASVPEVGPGEERHVTLDVLACNLAEFDEDRESWQLRAGEHKLLIANSADPAMERGGNSLAVTLRVQQ